MIKAMRREIMIVLIVFLVGVLVGWLLLGWVIAPVVWTDAAPRHLQTSYRDFFLRTVAIAYNGNAITADDLNTFVASNWSYDGVLTELNRLKAGPGGDTYNKLIDTLDFLKSQAGSAAGQPAEGGVSPVVWLLLLLVVVAAAILSVAVVRRAGGSAQVAASGAPGAAGTVSRAQAIARGAPVLAWPGESEAPLRQFEMTYVLGDDRFDMSNAIETPSGMFLGECGMGIGDTIGTPDPSKVTAFEVWLFDKNDIRTVTTVLMSDHAFNDATLKTKLAAKGDAVLAKKDVIIPLDTATLRVRAKVTELEYGSGQLPERSFFQRIKVVMAAWQVGDSGVTQPADVLKM